MKVFVDSDVVISSLMSKLGAAYYVIHNANIIPVISSLSFLEQEKVLNRMNLDFKMYKHLVNEKFDIVDMKQTTSEIIGWYSKYVLDIDDAHIIAGAHVAGTKFLITYNIKHYISNKIFNDLDIKVVTTSFFLQYLRSISK